MTRTFSSWVHYGAISAEAIKKKTQATRVLLPVTERQNVLGSSLIASPPTSSCWDGNVRSLRSMEMWEWVWQWREESGVVVPLSLVDKAKQRAATYRIVLLPSFPFWVEARGRHTKLGWPFQDNTYLLCHES